MKKKPKRFESVLWKTVPMIITLILFVFCIIPKHLWGMGYVMPALPLIPIFYWGRFGGAEISYWFVFIIGILTDAITGTPLGLSAILYLLFLAVLHAQSKYIHKEGFVIIWGYFMILLAGISFLQWLIISSLNGQFYATIPALIQLLVSISIYPLFHQFFDKISGHIKQRRWIMTHG